MIRNIFLYGDMASTYHREAIPKSVDSMFDVLSALKSELPDFRKYVSEHPEQMVILTDDNKQNPRPVNSAVGEDEFGDATEIHIIPNHNGAGIEIAVAVFGMAAGSVGAFVVNTLFAIVVSMALGALAQALSPSMEINPSDSNREYEVQQNPSFLFNGTQNVSEQGHAVPVIYGTHMTGSIVVGAGVFIEQLLTVPSASAPPANGGGASQPASPPAEAWQWGGGI